MKPLRNIGLVLLALCFAAAVIGCNGEPDQTKNPDSTSGVKKMTPDGKGGEGGAPATPTTE